MQITCPSCAAQYAVPDGMLAGRMVKCARCGEQWAPVPAEPALAAEPARAAPPRPFMAVPDPFPTPDPPAPPAPTPAQVAKPNLRPSLDRPPVAIPVVRTEAVPRPAIVLAAWVVSAAVLAALVIGAYVARDSIMQAWPPSQRIYGALGLR